MKKTSNLVKIGYTLIAFGVLLLLPLVAGRGTGSLPVPQFVMIVLGAVAVIIGHFRAQAK